jgi:GntR family transcriptional regulator/MocR family aminotransferase
MTTSHANLPIVVDRADGDPLAAQVSTQVRAAVTDGVLHAGDRLPSTRDLAATLGVSRTVVTSAYASLFAEGWLEGRHGSGTYVADVAPAPAPAARGARLREPRTGASDPREPAPGAGSLIELQPGLPWAAGIDPAAWRRAWRYAGTRPPSPWPDPHGLPELRAELAAYLRRSRGLGVSPADVLVTRGVSGGLALLAAALLRPGDKAGVEEPGYPAARDVLTRAGAQVVPCRVDAHGVVPEELPGDLRLLYTTPAHQYPLGGRLPVGRRQALTAWARATGAVVVEDDYDSEFRYDVGPLPALYSMDPEVIVYLGTASKALTPAFGAGWLVASPALVERIALLRPNLGERVPEPVQHALLALLTSGDMERHIRRMRLEYARRRGAIVEALTAQPAAGQPQRPYRLLGDTAGLHVVLELPAGLPPGLVVAEAARHGVGLHELDRYFAGPPSIGGLILGYGATPLTQVRRAAAVLATLLASLTSVALHEAAGQRFRPDRQRGGRSQLIREFPRVDLQHVRSGEPVGVDRPRAGVLAGGHLRRAEVTAARPHRAAAFGTGRQARHRLPGRPAARDSPRVEPLDDRVHADHRAVGERLRGVPENADLSAHPALGVDVPRGHRDRRRLFGIPVKVLGRPERAARPQNGDELDDVAGHRVPDQVAGTAFADEALRRRLDGNRAWRGPQGQPDRARRASVERASVSIHPDASCSWHPCVCHRFPSHVQGLDHADPTTALKLTYVSGCD